MAGEGVYRHRRIPGIKLQKCWQRGGDSGGIGNWCFVQTLVLIPLMVTRIQLRLKFKLVVAQFYDNNFFVLFSGSIGGLVGLDGS